jgi:trehalose synthase
VLHLSATAFGGGVSEILYALVPLMRDVGIEVEWQVMLGREEFYNVTKRLHNALQGSPDSLTSEEWEVFERFNEMNAKEVTDGWDVIIIHDPQPLAIRRHVPENAGMWIWRCHIDLSTPNEDAVERIVPHIRGYDESVFHVQDYVPASLDGTLVNICPPAIDPLSPKNMAFSPDDAAFVCDQFGLDVDRPLMCQVSRFDPWKDPMGVIDAYRTVTEAVPDVQLALVGSMAHDDPEGWHYIEVTDAHREGDPDIFLLTNLQEVGNLEVNAFQRASTIVVQKSLREGFGLVVSEGLWKEKPVIAGNVGGIRLQIEDGVNGFLVDTVEQCGERAIELLGDYERREKMGKVGRQAVRDRFLCIREVDDHLRMLASL